MLRIITTFLLAGVFIFSNSIVGKAQNKETPIIVALQHGSSKAVSSFLDDMVEIRFDNDKRDFSKNQAEIVLANFFKGNPVSSFELLKHQKIDSQTSYLIGNYTSLKNSFKVFIKGKELNNKNWLVYSIDFVRE
ncbi:DUF4783 domain-containing protein [uncultured Cyclobacterium sp.]|uniref:DUF4783 domain-containing protein n=1 Tax=uncultured Cyclobacterium sp. TaxID=453820 RepID=UPI0030EF6A76|tara:strand:- start:122254 stop:122655 length:402 start_codon:yes stop_codon:yes gene_type:complete